MRTAPSGFLLIILPVLLAGCAGPAPVRLSGNESASPAAPQAGSGVSGELRYRAPDGWVKEQPSSNMRVAQFQLPRAAGDSADGSLVVYYFGQGQGGSVEANLDRWMNQMKQADGTPSKDRAKVETKTVNGLKVTLLDVSGRYTAEMAPGADEHHDDASFRMRAAVIETPKGAYYVKLVGPEKTIAGWDSSFGSFVNSFEFK
jgi:hypothetical protein